MSCPGKLEAMTWKLKRGGLCSVVTELIGLDEPELALQDRIDLVFDSALRRPSSKCIRL